MRMLLPLLLAALAGAGPACGSDTISLAGQWRFEIAGTNATAFARELSGTIHLPGTMDGAGLGPKNTAPPTLAGPYRIYDYAGPAWYQRELTIPAAWMALGDGAAANTIGTISGCTTAGSRNGNGSCFRSSARGSRSP